VRWLRDYAFVDATVDGAGPYNFLIDTGTAIAAVSPAVAARHPGGVLRIADEAELLGPDGRTVPMRECVAIGDLVAGPLAVRGLDALVLDLDLFSGIFGVRVDGILGISVFSRGLLALDYPAQRVSYAVGALGPVDGRTILPLRRTADGTPQVQLEWEGRPLWITLDSGSNGGVDLKEWPPGARFLSGPVPGRLTAVLAGIARRRDCARVEGDLVLGRYRIRDPVVRVGSSIPHLGTEVLRHFRFVFDADRGRVEVGGLVDVLAMDSVLGTGAAIGPWHDRWIVWDVQPGSPGERAGLRAWDEVVSVDGIPAERANEDSIRAALEAEGGSVRLVVRRDGRDLRFEVPVEVQVR
jgi:hypothetical protein